jgi:hypothetical protein
MRRAALLGLALAVLTTDAVAQQARGSLGSLARYVQVRPVTRDSVAIDLVTTDANGRTSFNDVPVICVAETCTFYRSEGTEYALASTQELAFTSWGYGIEGLSATVMARARQTLGGEFTWPQSDDAFDVVLAYGELTRDRYRLRLGRQRSLTGLGFYSFDGLTAVAQLGEQASVEVYGGRSLARALEDPRHEALGAIENFIPDNNAWLVGAAAELNAGSTAGTLRYQREIWGDRAALVSERASLDFQTGALRFAQVQGAADYDVAYNRIGKAHLTLQRRLRNRVSIELTGTRYLPFFELWTIWGAFSPIAYHEAELQAGWHAANGRAVSASVSLRDYEDTEAPVFIAQGADRSKRLVLRARSSLPRNMSIDGEYRLETGFGAFLSSGDVMLGWSPDERLHAELSASALQQILEFRSGESVIYGLGANVRYRINHALEAAGGASYYTHGYDNRPSALDWHQKRAWLSVDWSFGRDPGLRTAQP